MASEDILIALRRIMRAIDLHSKKLERSAGLTVPQILILQTIGEADSLGVSEIARRVSLSQGTVTSIIDRMVRKDLVQRTRNDADRRVVSISLTGAGAKQLDLAPGLLQEEFISRFDALESWEQKMLTAAVERIAAIMDAESVDASPILQTGEIVPVNSENNGRNS
ncbi:MAG: MarR family transcriptional regulator [Xanthomonadales bacterium]